MSHRKFKKQSSKKQISEIRKNFYKRLLYIGICIIPIIIFADNNGKFRLVPLPFFLFGIYQLISIIQQSIFIIDDFFPPKTVFEKKTKYFDKFLYYFASTLFFVGLILLTFEIRYFDNTINGLRLFWIGGFVGIGLAIISTIMLKLFQPSVYDESKRRYTVHFGLFIGFFLLTAALTGFINHHYADPINFCKKYQLKSKSINSGKSTEYFFFLTMDGNNEERFSVGKNRYNHFEEGEQIELCMLKGKFGFDYVTDFKKVNN